jgi:hypothetical protein
MLPYRDLMPLRQDRGLVTDRDSDVLDLGATCTFPANWASKERLRA